MYVVNRYVYTIVCQKEGIVTPFQETRTILRLKPFLSSKVRREFTTTPDCRMKKKTVNVDSFSTARHSIRER